MVGILQYITIYYNILQFCGQSKQPVWEDLGPWHLQGLLPGTKLQTVRFQHLPHKPQSKGFTMIYGVSEVTILLTIKTASVGGSGPLASSETASWHKAANSQVSALDGYSLQHIATNCGDQKQNFLETINQECQFASTIYLKPADTALGARCFGHNRSRSALLLSTFCAGIWQPSMALANLLTKDHESSAGILTRT